MSTLRRCTLVAAVAALALAAAVACATARRLEVNNQRFRGVWSERSPVVFEAGVAGNISCAVTLEGSFHSRTFSKVSGSLVGYITHASLKNPCIGGEFHLLSETLPWHVRYASFQGTLPAITAVRFQIVGFSFWFELIAGFRCLYRSTAAEPIFGRFVPESGEPFHTPASFTLEGSVPETQGGACLGTIAFGGAGVLTAQESTTPTAFRLVA